MQNQIEVEWFIPNNPKNPNYIEKKEVEVKVPPKPEKKEEEKSDKGEEDPFTQEQQNFIEMISELQKIVDESDMPAVDDEHVELDTNNILSELDHPTTESSEVTD